MDEARLFAWTYLRFQRLVDRHLAEQGASFAKMRLLAFLTDGPARSTDIAVFFGHAPRTVTQAIDGLEAAGLVTRTADPRDRRQKHVGITAKGKALLQSAQPLYERVLEQTLGNLSEDERTGFVQVLNKLSSLALALERYPCVT